MMGIEGAVEAELIEEEGKKEETEEADIRVDLAGGTGILVMIGEETIEGMIEGMEVAEEEEVGLGLEEEIDQRFKGTGKRIGSRLLISLEYIMSRGAMSSNHSNPLLMKRCSKRFEEIERNVASRLESKRSSTLLSAGQLRVTSNVSGHLRG